MKARLAVLATVAASLALLAPAAAQARKPPTRYYVSLGDSLSVGEQPRPDGVTVLTNHGYVDQLADFERKRIPGLRKVKFGCGGERVTTIAKSSVACFYPRGNQLKQAAAFLRAHRKQLAFVTIDIGANDAQSCVRNGVINAPCLLTGLANVKKLIPGIAKRLRAAAGPHARIVGMTYYNPFLQQWLTGDSGRAIARASVPLSHQLNDPEVAAYKKNGFRIADVAREFRTYDLTTPGALRGTGPVPIGVENICKYTWMCSPQPIGMNIHATTAGYRKMAKVFVRALR